MAQAQIQYDVADTPWGAVVIYRQRTDEAPWSDWRVYVEAGTTERAHKVASALRKEDA